MVHSLSGAFSWSDHVASLFTHLVVFSFPSTGEYTRDELNKVAKLGWTDAAAQQIAAAKAAEVGGSTSEGSGTNSGTDSGGSQGGTQTGDNTQGGGSDNTGGGDDQGGGNSSITPGEGD